MGARYYDDSEGRPITIRILDLASNDLTIVPGSEGMFSPRWSPDGEALAAMSANALEIKVYEFATSTWRLVTSAESYFAYPHWTADSQSLLAEHADAIVRINVESGAREEVVPIDALRRVNGMFGEWLGFAPDNSPLVLRDTSIQEIFALEVEERD